jgi:HD-GYP domain-containing protein (c-di-GMP phosphodiesterase class II)
LTGAVSDPGTGTAGAAVTPGEHSAQRTARALLSALHGAVRAVRLYPVENAAVQKALAELVSQCERLHAAEAACDIRCSGDFVFVNDSRVRLGLDNFAAVSAVLRLLRHAGVGTLAVGPEPTAREWLVLLSHLQAPPLEYPEEARVAELERRIAAAAVHGFTLLPLRTDDEPDDDADQRMRARITYRRSLDVTREVITGARLGRSPALRVVKRTVQGLVDAILADEATMLGLTALREFDDYTFVHSVNVCILSVALGRRLGLGKVQLLDLGLAALLHDVGKARVPPAVLNKREALTEQELAVLRTHAWQGVLALLSMPATGSRPWRAMLAAYEHHMRDGRGYPTPVRTGRPRLFSRIITVADGFDAATSTRVYQQRPWSPADVLRGMRENPRLGLDPVLVKAFINLTGIYPVGTLVVLDTLELAVVVAAQQDPDALSRPLVRIVSDANGNAVAGAPLVDLTERDAAGAFTRSIIRTEDPDRHGIRIADVLA